MRTIMIYNEKTETDEENRKLFREINEQWKKFYRKARLRYVSSGKFRPELSDFLEHLEIKCLDLELSEDGYVDAAYTVELYRVTMETRIFDETIQFELVHLGSEVTDPTSDWVLNGSGGYHIEMTDTYEGYGDCVGGEIIECDGRLRTSDEAFIQDLLAEFQLTNRVETSLAYGLQKADEREAEEMKKKMMDSSLLQVERIGTTYTLTFDNGMSLMIGDHCIYTRKPKEA